MCVLKGNCWGIAARLLSHFLLLLLPTGKRGTIIEERFKRNIKIRNDNFSEQDTQNTQSIRWKGTTITSIWQSSLTHLITIFKFHSYVITKILCDNILSFISTTGFEQGRVLHNDLLKWWQIAAQIRERFSYSRRSFPPNLILPIAHSKVRLSW